MITEQEWAIDGVSAAIDAGDFAEAARLINATRRPTLKSRDASRHNWRTLQDIFGVDRVVAWRLAIQLKIDSLVATAAANAEMRTPLLATAEALKLFRETMAGDVGYPFSDERLQLQLETLFTIGVISLSDQVALRDLGYDPVDVLDAAQVRVESAAKQAHARWNVIEATRRDWDTLSADIRSRIQSGQLTRDQVVSAVTQSWS